jgi:hypothetical protein
MMKESVRIPLSLAKELSAWLLILKGKNLQNLDAIHHDAVHRELISSVRRSHPDLAEKLEKNWNEPGVANPAHHD